MNITVIGLGKLGSVLAAVLADKGHHVIGVDLNPAYVQAINAGHAPVEEPGLADLIAAAPFLSATASYDEAVLDADIIFVVVPTPSESDGTFSLRYVLSAMKEIGRVLYTKPGFPVVVLVSTVLPGSMTTQILPLLESTSEKQCGIDFGLCYNPEFIALGSVIHDMRNPDLVLIGESDARSGKILSALYATICASTLVVAHMSFVNAELTKISVNTYVTMKISYANMLAGICEKLPGADVDAVTQAIGLDSRIGSKYLRGALGYGGPCLPRDCAALSSVANRVGIDAILPDATDTINRMQVTRIANKVVAKISTMCSRRNLVPSMGKVGILGLSYKPDTGVTEESQSLLLIRELSKWGFQILAYDPMVKDIQNKRVKLCSSMAECASSAHLIVIMTAWKEFKQLRPGQLNHALGRPAILDCWRILDRDVFSPLADYMTIGEGPRGIANSAGL